MRLCSFAAWTVALLIAGLGVPVTGQDARQDAVSEDMKRLQGWWVIRSAQCAGQPSELLSGKKVLFAGNRVKFVIGGKVEDQVALYKLAPATRPKQIDITFLVPRNATPHKGIYRFHHGHVEICLPSLTWKVENGGELVIVQGPRPQSFNSQRGLVLTLSRQPK
jgi:uncharacterized protein (TIGR03067 family)